jgi:hypothetical protein
VLTAVNKTEGISVTGMDLLALLKIGSRADPAGQPEIFESWNTVVAAGNYITTQTVKRS